MQSPGPETHRADSERNALQNYANGFPLYFGLDECGVFLHPTDRGPHGMTDRMIIVVSATDDEMHRKYFRKGEYHGMKLGEYMSTDEAPGPFNGRWVEMNGPHSDVEEIRGCPEQSQQASMAYLLYEAGFRGDGQIAYIDGDWSGRNGKNYLYRGLRLFGTNVSSSTVRFRAKEDKRRPIVRRSHLDAYELFSNADAMEEQDETRVEVPPEFLKDFLKEMKLV